MSSTPPLPELEDDYLWDPDAPVDASVAALEDELAPLRYDGRAPDFTAVEPVPRSRSKAWWAVLAAAAAVALVVGVQLSGDAPQSTGTPSASSSSAVALPTPRPAPSPRPATPAAPTGWRLDVIGGAPTCNGAVVDGATRLRPGVWLDTQLDARARLAIADIGSAEVGPGVRLRITDDATDVIVVELARGMIEVSVEAPAERFAVDTPFGRVVDLGCRYTVDVQPDRLLLEVGAGAVALRRDGEEVRIEAGQRLLSTKTTLGEPTTDDVWRAPTPAPSGSEVWGAP